MLVYVGAVMVLFLFVVMMLDVNFDSLRKNFRSYLPVGATVGVLVLLEMVLVLVGSNASARGVAPPRRRGQQHARARPAALRRLRVSVRDRGGDPAGRDHRRDRADASQAPARRSTRIPAAQVKVRRQDRVRLLDLPAEKRES